MLGRTVPGAGHLGMRGTDLDALPKTSVEVDGSKAFVTLEIAVRWPARWLRSPSRSAAGSRTACGTWLGCRSMKCTSSWPTWPLTSPRRLVSGKGGTTCAC